MSFVVGVECGLADGGRLVAWQRTAHSGVRRARARAHAPRHRATAATPQLSRLIAAITLTGLGPTKDNTAIQLYTYVVCSSSAQAKLRNNNQTVFTPLQDEL